MSLEWNEKGFKVIPMEEVNQLMVELKKYGIFYDENDPVNLYDPNNWFNALDKLKKAKMEEQK